MSVINASSSSIAVCQSQNCSLQNSGQKESLDQSWKLDSDASSDAKKKKDIFFNLQLCQILHLKTLHGKMMVGKEGKNKQSCRLLTNSWPIFKHYKNTTFLHFWHCHNCFVCLIVFTCWDGPDCHDLDSSLGVGVEAAVVYRVSYGDVSIQRNGTQVHDGCGGEQDV